MRNHGVGQRRSRWKGQARSQARGRIGEFQDCSVACGHRGDDRETETRSRKVSARLQAHERTQHRLSMLARDAWAIVLNNQAGRDARFDAH